MFCGNCGNQNPTGNNYCGRCGGAIYPTSVPNTDYLPAYARFSQPSGTSNYNQYNCSTQSIFYAQNLPQQSQIQQSIENDVRNGEPLVNALGNPSQTLR